jgi:hypothetical protein
VKDEKREMTRKYEHLPAFQIQFMRSCLVAILGEAVLTGWSKHRLLGETHF